MGLTRFQPTRHTIASNLNEIYAPFDGLSFIFDAENDLARPILMPENQIEITAVLIQNSSDILSELRDKTRMTTALAVMAEGSEWGIVLASFPGTADHTYVPRVGFHFHLHCTAPGKALLSGLPKDQRKTVLAKLNYRKFTGRTVSNAADLDALLEQYADLGYAMDAGEYAEGINCVATCLCDEDDQPLAAIWITAPSIELPEKDLGTLAKKVMHAAKKIQGRLATNSPDASPYVNQALSEAKTFIEEHFADEAAIHNFIEGLFMSQSWFRTRFRETYGISPMNYRQNLVFKKAQQLLELTALPIKEIANQLGFDSQNYFSRAFKKRYGQSPGHFRESRKIS